MELLINTNTGTLSIHNSCQINVDELSSILSTNNYSGLNIKYSFIESNDIDKIIGAIIKNRSIKLLNLCGTDINSNINIFKMLSINKSLLKLNLSCNQLAASHIELIMNSMLTNSTLQKLNLSSNYLDNTCASNIANMLSVNNSLKVLNISDNCIDDIGISKIMTALKNNSSLCSLKLCRNYFGNDCCSNIAEMLSINKSLKILGIRDILVYNNTIETIIKSLENNHVLTEMYIGFNYFGTDDETFLTLNPLLQRNKDLYDNKRFFITKSANTHTIK